MYVHVLSTCTCITIFKMLCFPLQSIGHDIHTGTLMRSCFDSVLSVHMVYSSLQVRPHPKYYIYCMHVSLILKTLKHDTIIVLMIII